MKDLVFEFTSSQQDAIKAFLEKKKPKTAEDFFKLGNYILERLMPIHPDDLPDVNSLWDYVWDDMEIDDFIYGIVEYYNVRAEAV